MIDKQTKTLVLYCEALADLERAYPDYEYNLLFGDAELNFLIKISKFNYQTDDCIHIAIGIPNQKYLFDVQIGDSSWVFHTKVLIDGFTKVLKAIEEGVAPGCYLKETIYTEGTKQTVQ